MPELLLEILSQEIPARMQKRAAEDLKRLVLDGLKKARLAFAGADAYTTPRRLVLVVEGLPEQQPDLREERKGPKVGAPDFSDIEDRKLPKTNGAPLRTSCAYAQTIMASATACATLAAVDTGPIAPERMNGTTTIPWPRPQ